MDAMGDDRALARDARIEQVLHRTAAGRHRHGIALVDAFVRMRVHEQVAELGELRHGLEELARAGERKARHIDVTDAPARRLVPSLRQRAAGIERGACRLDQIRGNPFAGVHHRLAEAGTDAAAHELLCDDVAEVRRPHVQDRRRPRGE